MANFINKYLSQSDYENDDTKQYPNVSLVNGTLIYEAENPIVPFGGLTVTYNIANPNVEVTIFNGDGGSSSSGSSESGSGGGGILPTTMIIDGVEETPINTWRFETAGEHIVQYEFETNFIPEDFLNTIHEATEVIIGEDIVEIGAAAFMQCINLESVTLEATTPPNLVNTNAFTNTNNCPIYVPAESVEAYKAATNWSSFASRIQAIPSE